MFTKKWFYKHKRCSNTKQMSNTFKVTIYLSSSSVKIAHPQTRCIFASLQELIRNILVRNNSNMCTLRTYIGCAHTLQSVTFKNIKSWCTLLTIQHKCRLKHFYNWQCLKKCSTAYLQVNMILKLSLQFDISISFALGKKYKM